MSTASLAEAGLQAPVAGRASGRPDADRLDVLDAVRACAALSIFVFHYFVLWPGAFPETWAGFRHLVGNYAGMGVPVFYALSGLSLCLGFFERRSVAGFVREFYIKRFFRIAPLFYTALAVWCLIVLSRGALLDVQRLLLSASLLFNLIPGVHDSYVAAGWSIGVEVLFYLAFPALIHAISGWRSGTVAFLVGAVFSLLSYQHLNAKVGADYAGMSVAAHLHYFLAGIAAYFLARRLSLFPRPRWIGAALIVFALVMVWILTHDAFWRISPLVDNSVVRVLWAIPICIVLVAACLVNPQNALVRNLAIVGHWSYSIYLLHPILLYFVFEWVRVQKSGVRASGPNFVFYFTLVLAVLIGLSALVFRLFEKPFIRLGRDLVLPRDAGGGKAWLRFKLAPGSPRYSIGCMALLAIVCASFHIRQATRFWDNSIHGHHGFRQGQTALTTQVILRDGYKLAYETPVFGPPWSIPMEFPVYQLIVAGLTRLSDAPMENVGRGVSLAFFYLSVGACWWLLTGLGVNLPGRLAACCFLLVAPLYVFWSRAFLIESTSLFLSLCFAAAIISLLKSERHLWTSAAVAILAGVLAASSKVTTFSVSLGLVILLVIHEGMMKAVPWRRAAAALVTCATSLAVGYVWVKYSDFVKAAHGTPMANVILSHNLHAFNFGTIAQRLRADFWERMHLHGVSFITFSLWPWLLLVAGVAVNRTRFATLFLVAAFFSGPLVFANLYFVHDYYWYANSVYLLAALAVGVGSIYDAGVLGRLAAVVSLSGFTVMGISRYSATPYSTYQSANDISLKVLGERIAEITNERDVVMMVGFDWDSSLAYFAGRRAIMPWVRSFEVHPDTIRAVQRLSAEGRRLALLAVTTAQRSNAESMRQLQGTYGFASIPIHEDVDYALYPVTSDRIPADSVLAISSTTILERSSAAVPVQPIRVNGKTAWLAHAPSRLEFTTPGYPARLQFEFGLDPRAYAGTPATDGVLFAIILDGATEGSAPLWSRTLRPAMELADCGTHKAELADVLPPNTRLVLQTETGGADGTWDWSYWANLRAIPAPN
jgi:peptidoglycan/LPS O-acetylase OafA/YrhL